MHSVRLGILASLTLLPAFAQVPAQVLNVALPDQTREQNAPHQFGPIRDMFEEHNGTANSTNWSGYAVLGPAFKTAEGSWTVPAVNCSGVTDTEYAAFWVGMDGYNANSPTVEQTGTASYCQGTKAAYYAWFEFYPNPSKLIATVPVSPNDVISASVAFAGGKFTITLTDVTTGKTFSKTAAVSGAKRNSAEWIIEAPCCTNSGGTLPLADFVTGSFGYDSTGVSGTDQATDQNRSGPIGAWPSQYLKQINKVPSSTSPQMSTCFALTGDLTSFSCSWAP